MPLIRVWNCPFAPQAEGCGIPILTAKAASDADRTVFGRYETITRYTPHPNYSYGYISGPLWADNNHSQAERLYLGFIMQTSPGNGVVERLTIPKPLRVLDDAEMVAGLDLYGGRISMSLCANNLHLSKAVQLALLLQWDDPEANNGRGANVNYLLLPRRSIDERLGFTPSPSRSASGEQRTTGWIDIDLDLPVDNPDTAEPEDAMWLRPIDGTSEKVKYDVYGRSRTVRDAYRRRLLNIMLVFHCGQTVPPYQPTSRAGGGFGELYIRKAEIWVDPALNLNAVEV